MRRFLLVLAVLGVCTASAAVTRRTPRAIIDEIYSREGVLGLDPEDRHEYFSRGVVAWWAKADAANDGGLTIDFDLASNSQGMEVGSYKVRTVHSDAGHVTLDVTLTSRGDYIIDAPSDLVVRYDFIRENGRWLIDDMSSTTAGSPWTLRALLRDLTR